MNESVNGGNKKAFLLEISLVKSIHTYIHTGDDMGKQGKTKRQQPSYGGLLVYADFFFFFLDDLHFYAN